MHSSFPDTRPKFSEFENLSQSLFKRIVSHLSFKETLAIDSLSCRISTKLVAIDAWGNWMDKSHLRFTWHIAHSSSKRNAILNTIFWNFWVQRDKFRNERPNADAIARICITFKKATKGIPFFNYYFQLELNSLIGAPYSLSQSIEKQISDAALQPDAGGENLLYALILNVTFSKDISYKHFKIAAEKKVGIASIIAIKTLTQRNQDDLFAICIENAKFKDYRGLKLYLDHHENYAWQLHAQHYPYPPIYDKLGQLEQQQGNAQNALSFYGKAIAGYERNVPPFLLWNKAIIHFRLKEYKEAKELYKKAIEAFGKIVPAKLWINLAINCCYLNEFEEAKICYRQAIHIGKDKVPAFVLWNAAINCLRLKEYNEAKALLRKAIVAYKHTVPIDLVHDLAITYCHLRQFDQATALLKSIIEKKGGAATSVPLHLADIYFDLKNYAMAKKYFKIAVAALQPRIDIQVLHDLATTYHFLGKYDTAIKLLQSIIANNDNVPAGILLHLADAYYDRENYENAKECYAKAIDAYKMTRAYDASHAVAYANSKINEISTTHP